MLFILQADGCFIKLTIGAEILAAISRDRNKNMYPTAFAVVPVEDTTNWFWFPTQVKYALGGIEGEFGSTQLCLTDRRYVVEASSSETSSVVNHLV